MPKEKTSKKLTWTAVIFGILSFSLIIFFIITGWLGLWILIIPFSMTFATLIIVLIVKVVSKTAKPKVDIKKFKGLITEEQFKDMIDKKMKYVYFFNYKPDFSIVSYYLGDKPKELSGEKEDINRIPVFEVTLEHMYKNDKFFILMDKTDPEHAIWFKGIPTEKQITEWKENFALAKERKLLRTIIVTDPQTGKVVETITSEPEREIRLQEEESRKLRKSE